MVNSFATRLRPQSSTGFLTVELVVAMGILALVLLPLGYGFVQEQQLARAYYHRAIAMEIVDGEMERVLAGEWRSFAPGTHAYPVSALSATNLPPGRFLLTRTETTVRLEWIPNSHRTGGPVVRDVKLK
jgi:hypothetical protein